MTNNNLQITYLNIHDLRFADYNPRRASKKEFDDLKANILKFGFVDPILVNSNENRKNIIIGGHFRARVAKKLKMTHIPVVYVDIADIEEEKELNIRLNKNTGSWDFDLLGNYFDTDFLQDCGFTAAELGMGDITSNVGESVNTQKEEKEFKTITLKFDNDKYLEIIDLLHQAKDGLGFQTNEELIENLLRDNI